MKPQLESGDIVMLKSGGPRLTVGNIDPANENSEYRAIWCSWLDNNAWPHTTRFWEPMLMYITGENE